MPVTITTSVATRAVAAAAGALGRLADLEAAAHRSSEAKRRLRRRIEFALDLLEDSVAQFRQLHTLMVGAALLFPRDQRFATIHAAAQGVLASLGRDKERVEAIVGGGAPDMLERLRTIWGDQLAEVRETEALLEFFSAPPDIIEYQGRRFRAREPLGIKLGKDLEGWTMDVEAFGILEYGRSFREAWDAFRMHFAWAWDSVASVADEQLSSSAKEVKSAMLKHIELVQP